MHKADQPWRGASHSSPTYYHLLSVPQNASLSTIKAAYRKVLLTNHPDKTQQHPSVDIGLLHTAYAVLKSEPLRREYDQFINELPTTVSSRVSQTVSLDDFQQTANQYLYPCRCGSSFLITQLELEQEIHIIGCDGCSERLWVMYDVELEDQ